MSDQAKKTHQLAKDAAKVLGWHYDEKRGRGGPGVPALRRMRRSRSAAVSRYHGNSEQCFGCGISYGDFRTGLTYREVWLMLADNSTDPSDWKYKRRGTILGNWHAIKQQLWERHKEECVEAIETRTGEVPF
jgi:hypothetical protein